MEQKGKADESRWTFGQDKVAALLLLAGFDVVGFYRLENAYWPDADRYTELHRSSPWWLAQTLDGDLIQIGCHKRIISISWAQTKLRAIITQDHVTKDCTMVHAASYSKAVEYLTSLHQELGALAPTPVGVLA